MKKPRRTARLRTGVVVAATARGQMDPAAPDRRRHEGEAVPLQWSTYEEGLLDRMRQHWRRGEWDALADLPMEQVESHPQRGRIAMLIASAWQAKGHHGQTRQLVQLARQWGADEGLLARVLLAGVHNTLGKACAAGGQLRDQALFHFRAALQPAGSVAAGRTGLQARMRNELLAMGAPDRVERWLAGDEALNLPAPTEQARQQLPATGDVLAQLEEMGRTVESTLQRELANAVKQLEAYNNLQGYLQSGELMPTLHGWPVSPDFALLLVQILEQHEFDAVVEFGSGSSTLLVAKTLAHLALRRPRQRRPVQMAFEHLEKYHTATRELLEGSGLLDRVCLELAPLVPTSVSDGQTFRYYDLTQGLQTLGSRLSEFSSPRLLVIVDGPPEATGPFARYPAMELLLQAFPRQRAAYLMDDYRRPGEQEIARRWRKWLESRGIESQLTSYPLEKMACLIRFDASIAAIPVDSKQPN